MPDIHIRLAKKSDADALVTLSGELGYPVAAEEMVKRLGRLLIDPHHAIYVAETDFVAGWIHICELEFLESGRFAEIVGMVVTESHRGSGIGTRLVAEAEQWAITKGCPRLRVRSNIIRHHTHEFYEKKGFASLKTQKVFEKILMSRYE